MQQPPDDDENRPVPQLGSLTAPPERPDLKKRIMESKQKLLNNIKGKFTGEETGRWLDNIDQSPSRADESIGPGSLIDESQLSMPAFVDMLFDHLQRYVFEYNKIPSNQDNLLNCERPQNYQERSEYGAQSSRVKYMRGHLSSRTWSLVFDALDEEISLYIVPTEFLIGFEPTSDFAPYLTISKEMGMTSVMWTIGGKRLGVEELTRFARKLITHLVKVIKGEAQSTEKFSFSPTENRFEEPVSPDRSFEQIPETDIGLHRAAKDVYAPSYAPVVALPSVPEIPEIPSAPETRSGMLKRLMEIAQQEEQESRSFILSGVRQLSNRATVAAPSKEVAPAAVAAPSMPKPPGAFGSPGSTSGMPTPPGAFGQGGGNSSGLLTGPPGGFGMPTAPGALGNVGVPSGTTPAFPTPPGGLGGLPSSAPGAQAAPTPPSFPMPPGAFGAPALQAPAPAPQPAVSQNSVPPITAPGGFGAALGALGSLVPPGHNSPPANELSRILDIPVTAETGPLPASPSGVSPMHGVPQPPPGSAPMPPEGLGFGQGGFGQLPRPSQAVTGGHPPVAPVAPQLPPGFGMPPAESPRPELPESNHLEQEDDFDDPLPPAPSGGWDFSFSSGPAAPVASPTPALPPPAPPAPPPMPAQISQQMTALPPVSPVTPSVPAPATLPPAPLAPPVVSDESQGEQPPVSKSLSRGISALFDEDDGDEPLSEIIEPPSAPPVPTTPTAPTAPTGRGLAGLVRRDAAPKPPAEQPSTPEPTASPRSLKDAVASAIRSAEEPAEVPGDRTKRPTLQSLLSGSESGDPVPVAPEPKIQPVPPVGQLGLPLSQPGHSVTNAPVVQSASASPAAPAQATPLPTLAPQPTPPSAAQAITQPPAPPQSQPVVFSTGDPVELAKQVDDAQRHAVEGCNRIVSELDIALKGLQEAGARAMQEGNFEAVTKVMEQANRLKGVRERMAQLTQEIAGV